jgi:Tfp pilus assembly protein PilX
MTILLIILIVLMIASFGGGLSRPQYRTPGISLGTILLIVLILWLLGVFGSRPF